MTPEDIYKWIREEHEMVEKLSRGLHAQVAIVPRSNLRQWIDQLRVALRHYEDHLTQHFKLEEAGGYLEAVMERRPTLALEVDRLQHQHQELWRILASIRRDLDPLAEADALSIEDVCLRIQNMLRYVSDHEQRENLIVISVFTHDLGTKD